MLWSKDKILSVLDKCTTAYTFPMLDNGYVYLAATRMSLYRSATDWALVIEIFGFSPRSAIPDTQIYTFASLIYNRNERKDYVSDEAYQNYLANNPHNESNFVFPVENDTWINEEDPEFVNDKGSVLLRGKNIPLPAIDTYIQNGITPESETPQVFELCRLIAAEYRDQVLASPWERRVNVLPGMQHVLQLEEWHHPDAVNDELPSQCESFQLIAEVLENGDISRYKQTSASNTAWENWPEGGTL